MASQSNFAPFARLENDTLIVGNDLIERRWRLIDGRLYAISLQDLSTGRDWVTQRADLASLTNRTKSLTAQRVALTSSVSRTCVVEESSLQADLTVTFDGRSSVYRFKVFGGLAAIGMQLVAAGAASASASGDSASPGSPSGVETDAPKTGSQIDPNDVIDAIRFDHLHCWLLQTRFIEQTDVHDNLVFENRWSLSTSERKIELAGNLFYIEHRPSGAGMALLKEAPTPEFRPIKGAVDLDLRHDRLTLRGHGLDDAGGAGYMQWTILYQGDRVQRIHAIQGLQRKIRPYVAGRDGVLVSNTWGDRSRDACISESFMLKEIAAGAEMGVDVAQIDDGWQRGRTANSAATARGEAGGVWDGFWASDPNFWDANPDRFPNGLQPLLASLKKSDMQLGLWYAPDSSNDCSKWEKDAQQILKFYRTLGVRHVKIDAVKMHSKLAETRLHQFYNSVIEGSGGAVTFDPDVTAEVRPGYWGQLRAGTIFVENRYTDWHNYWPHHTLRNLWRLSHHVHPMRLRMEFLNATRNTDKYAGDPLAPSNYTPAALFAMVMMSSPLAWFELSNAPAADIRQIGELVRVWKSHREQIFSSSIVPVGDEPDGYSWSGFLTHRPAGDGYAVAYRPLGEQSEFSIDLPRKNAKSADWLHGEGSARIEGDKLLVRVDKPLGYGFVRVAF